MNTHDLFHALQKYLKKWYHNDKKEFDVTQLTGYRAMCRMENFIKKHPEIVEVHVDDASFASSSLYLIPHKGMGVTVWFIPQCTSEQNEFFLYPHHLDNLINELKKMKRGLK